MRNSIIYRLYRGIWFLYLTYVKNLDRKLYGYIADDVTLIPPIKLSNPKNIFLYGDNGLKNATIYATSAKFIMKPHSGAAEGLHVSTGNHAMVIGKFYRTIKQNEKPKHDYKDVVIESDVWIGRNVIILPEVHIGRGCTIAAGAVITKSMPPYCVIGGVPAKPIKFKWTIDQVLEHESILYDESDRFTRDELESIFDDTKKKYCIK